MISDTGFFLLTNSPFSNSASPRFSFGVRVCFWYLVAYHRAVLHLCALRAILVAI